MSSENTAVQSSTKQGRAGAKMIHMLESNREALVRVLAVAESERTRQFRQWQIDGLEWVLTDYHERFENASTPKEVETVFQDIKSASVPQHEYGVEFVKCRMWLVS